MYLNFKPFEIRDIREFDKFNNQSLNTTNNKPLQSYSVLNIVTPRRSCLFSQGKYTSKSDVWSFAVTLWEILMFCSHQPLAELTNEQVVENANHMYLSNGKHRYAEPPPSCPREMYEIMAECWKRSDSDRPKFSEIHLFLQRKNLGYVPVI